MPNIKQLITQANKSISKPSISKPITKSPKMDTTKTKIASTISKPTMTSPKMGVAKPQKTVMIAGTKSKMVKMPGSPKKSKIKMF